MHCSDRFLRFFAGGWLAAVGLMCLVACGGSSSSTPSNQAPTITTQPSGATISSGQTANLNVTATGTNPLSYQWYHGSSGDTSTPVGTNSSSYSSPPLNSSTNYWVKVSNSGGSAGSKTATVTVVTPPANAVQIGYLGMDMNGGIKGIGGQQPWPTVNFGAVRLWDASVSWYDLNQGGRGVYDWSKLDAWLSLAPEHGADILYTFGRTPPWAVNNPNNSTCGVAPGTCEPPSDVDTTDEIWTTFVQDLVSRSLSSQTGHIKYYELWNEMDNPASWTGTPTQMARMSADAIQKIQSLDPDAIIVTPSVIVESSDGRSFLGNFLSQLQSSYPSTLQALGAISFHGYVQQNGQPLVPENIATYVDQTRQILAGFGLSAKPLFDTEASWGDPTVSNPAFTDLDMQASFVARMYLLQWSENVSRFYWYQWNNKTFGTLWTPDPNNPANPGTVLPPGIAYGQVYQWLVGAVMSQGCTPTTATGSAWTCELTSTAPSGYQALAVWDASQSCNNGTCTTSNYTLPSQYIQYRDLAGNPVSLAGQATVPIGAKPILLENQCRAVNECAP